MCGIHHVYGGCVPDRRCTQRSPSSLDDGCSTRCARNDATRTKACSGGGRRLRAKRAGGAGPRHRSRVLRAGGDPKTTSGTEKSSKLPPTFRGYSNNLKADLIYAKFHVDSVVAARERRHIDQARRDRMFKLQMLRKRKKEEADSNRAEERKQHQSQLLEEANANVEQEQVEDGPEDGTSTVLTETELESSAELTEASQSNQSSAVERMPSSPHLNIDLIRPKHNHAFTISPKHTMISAVRPRPLAASEKLSSSKTNPPKVLKLEKKIDFVDEDENLSFKRRGRGTSNLEGDYLGQSAETRPTRNKALLYLRNYNDELTTLNSKTPIDFNRMAKQERYPSWIFEKEATAAKMSTQSCHAYLESYRKRMEKRVEMRTIRVSKDDRRRILAFAGKGDATKKKPKKTGAQTLYYERKNTKVLTPHEEKMQLKHIERLKVEQEKRVKANALLAASKRRRRRRKDQQPDTKSQTKGC